MKKVNISVSVEQEKLRAIQFYATKKDSSLQTELDDFIQKLYEKYVPAQTREYIESLDEEKETPRRPSRPAPSPTALRTQSGDANWREDA